MVMLRRPEPDRHVSRAVTLARWLDDRFLDPLLGLVPGAGDVIAGLLGLYIVWVALKKRLPKRIVLRMLLNLGIDTLVGAVPVAGDVFDFVWKANKKNARLLVNSLQPRPV
jgi:hypothetical protein